MNFRDDITLALKNRPDIDFEFVRLHQYEEILHRFAEHFLIKGRSSLKHEWLWDGQFRHEVTSSQPQDIIASLEKVLSPMDRYWFLVSDDSAKHTTFWVADATGSGIISVLKEMYQFEYYIVDRKMNWLLCENHHGMLIEAGVPAIQS
jgi:hypothetical protein